MELMKVREMMANVVKAFDHGVILYGAGERCVRAIKAFKRFNIEVKQIADREEGKPICGFTAVSLDEMINNRLSDICIITPASGMKHIEERLRREFVLLDYVVVYWLLYYFPEDFEFKKNSFPFCHYESPYPLSFDINNRAQVDDNKIRDIDLNVTGQINCISDICAYTEELSEFYSHEGGRFRFDNDMFTGLDALALWYFLRTKAPKRIIEIGSGFSTRIMLDYNEKYNQNKTEIISIEPDPIRVQGCIKTGDNIKLLKKPVQEVGLDCFDALQENDILFIDSSHMIRYHGDVPYEYFHILPRLKKGVIIHIHDIHWPYEYCEKWIREGRAYNEAYLLRALLMNSSSYGVLLFNSMIEKEYGDYLKGTERLQNPLYPPNGSFWMKKCRQ